MVKRLGIILPLCILFIWEILAIVIDNNFILPKLESIAMVLVHPTEDILGTGSLLENALRSVERVGLGFFLATGIGVPAGIFMGRSKRIQSILDPTIQMLRPIPPLAWIPLALAWFKFGLTSIVFIIFIGAFFPILLNTIDGVRSVRNTWVEIARTLGATEREILVKVILPGAAPTMWTGLRLGFGIAWMSVVAAEMIPGTTSGLGYIILYSYNFAQLQVIIAGMIVIGLIGIGVDFFFKEVEGKNFAWRSLER